MGTQLSNGVTKSRLNFRETFISFINNMPDDPNNHEEEEEEEEDNFQLTDDQVADFRDAFKKFDAAGLGEIPTSELGTVMKMLGHKLNDELEECIKMVDSDGGGSVDIDEFMELMRTKTKEAQDEVEVKEAFRVLDKEGKGEIHTDVIKEILAQLDDSLTDQDLKDLIAEIDSDGSGWVDYDEFKALMLG